MNFAKIEETYDGLQDAFETAQRSFENTKKNLRDTERSGNTPSKEDAVVKLRNDCSRMEGKVKEAKQAVENFFRDTAMCPAMMASLKRSWAEAEKLKVGAKQQFEADN